MKTRFLVLPIALMAFQLSAADAQNPVRRPGAAGANRPALGQAGQPGQAGGPAALERVLTDEQRQKMREFMQEQGGDLRENMQKLAQLRRELNVTVLSGKADEKFIKEKTDAIAKLDAEQLRARMMALSKVVGTLTPEQREKLKDMGDQLRAARPGLGAGERDGGAPRKSEPAAPPPPEK